MRRRFLAKEGFGLVELLIAMTLLSIGIFAIVAGFSAGAASLARASQVSTAGVVADKQLELYRGIAWTSIGLHTPSVSTSDATYQGDSAFDASPPAGTCTSAALPECNPSRSTTGPDGRSYRVDSYVSLDDNGSLSRQVKRVTVVVRDGADPTRPPYARQISTFDALG